MDEPDFQEGRLTIRYLDEHPELLEPDADESSLVAVAVAAALLEDEDRQRHRSPRIGTSDGSGMSPWRAAILPGRDGAR
jgi:hypothetical protein